MVNRHKYNKLTFTNEIYFFESIFTISKTCVCFAELVYKKCTLENFPLCYQFVRTQSNQSTCISSTNNQAFSPAPGLPEGMVPALWILNLMYLALLETGNENTPF